MIEVVGAGMMVDAREEAFEGHPVVQILAGMNLIGEVDPRFVESVEDRPPAFRELAERLLDQSRRALRPRIEIGPGERARKTRMGIKAQSPARLGGEVELLDRPFLPLGRPARTRVV